MKRYGSIFSVLRNTILCIAVLSPIYSAHAEIDPPSRVARLNYFDGPVTFSPAGSNDWAYAVVNRPLTSGDQLWVDKGGRSELHIGSTALRMNALSSLAFSTLDDHTTQLSLTQGALDVRVRSLGSGQVFEIDTPNLAFTLQSPGEYRINVDPITHLTDVIVRSGRGVATGNNGTQLELGRQQEVAFSGVALTQVSANDVPAYDNFDKWIAQRNRHEDKSISARYVSREVTGYEELDNHGTWHDTPQYGPIWVPTVRVANWAPYHDGHWAWVAPWGWTWVDNAPWGFAPFHYGRWAYVESGWAWVPGPIHVQPVYAPALVAFIGGNSGGRFSWSISLSNGNPGVAWFPLAPGEFYRPAYAVSPTYVNNLNRTVYVNKTVTNNININKTVNNNVTNNITNTYINQAVPNAVSAMPANAFVQGHSVQSAAQRVNPGELAKASVGIAPTIAPVQQSMLGTAKPAPVMPTQAASITRKVVALHEPSEQHALPEKSSPTLNAKVIDPPAVTIMKNDHHVPSPPLAKMSDKERDKPLVEGIKETKTTTRRDVAEMRNEGLSKHRQADAIRVVPDEKVNSVPHPPAIETRGTQSIRHENSDRKSEHKERIAHITQEKALPETASAGHAKFAAPSPDHPVSVSKSGSKEVPEHAGNASHTTHKEVARKREEGSKQTSESEAVNHSAQPSSIPADSPKHHVHKSRPPSVERHELKPLKESKSLG